MAKMGAPPKFFDWNILESLAIVEADCRYVAERILLASKELTLEEITKTHIDAMVVRINRKLKARFGITYVQYVDQKKESWRVKLRVLQRKSAEAGNATMQIWLGKQDLGQTDKQENWNKNRSSSESKLIIEFSNDEEKESEV